MKKYIFLLLITAISFGQASNQMVTYTQAQSLGFALNPGQAHVSSNQCMTKLAALTKYRLNSTSMSGYTDNRLVPRSTWVTAVTSYQHYYVGPYASASTACYYLDNLMDIPYLYASSNTLVLGMQFYTDANLTIPYSGNGTYYASSNNSFIISGVGTLSTMQSCTPSYYESTISTYNNLTASTACNYIQDITVYSTEPPVMYTILYTDPECTMPFSAGSSARFRAFAGYQAIRYNTYITEIIDCQ